jgi:TM2 domain-containing membrane protein YozV
LFLTKEKLLDTTMEKSEVEIMRSLTEAQRLQFSVEMSRVRKNKTTCFLYNLLLGGVGAHRFYLGQKGLGLLYLLFVWTFVPAFISCIDLFLNGRRVRKVNTKMAMEIADRLKSVGAPSVAA